MLPAFSSDIADPSEICAGNTALLSCQCKPLIPLYVCAIMAFPNIISQDHDWPCLWGFGNYFCQSEHNLFRYFWVMQRWHKYPTGLQTMLEKFKMCFSHDWDLKIPQLSKSKLLQGRVFGVKFRKPSGNIL